MTDQPSLFQVAPVQQWMSGNWPYIIWNECSVCGYNRFEHDVPPTFCPNCGAVLTGGRTSDEINEKWRKIFEEDKERWKRNGYL